MYILFLGIIMADGKGSRSPPRLLEGSQALGGPSSATPPSPMAIRIRSGVDVWRRLDKVIGTSAFASPRPDSSLGVSMGTPRSSSSSTLRAALSDLQWACTDPAQQGSHFSLPGQVDSYLATSNITMDCRHSYTATIWMKLSPEQPMGLGVLFSCSATQFVGQVTCSLNWETEGQIMVVLTSSTDKDSSRNGGGDRSVVGFVPSQDDDGLHMWRVTHNATSSIIAVFLDEQLQFIGELPYPFKGHLETQLVWSFGSGVRARISEVALYSGDVSAELLRYVLEGGPTGHMADRLGCAHSNYHSAGGDAAVGTLFSKMQYSARVTSTPAVVLTPHHFAPQQQHDDSSKTRSAWAPCEAPLGKVVDPDFLEFDKRFPGVDRTSVSKVLGDVEVHSDIMSPLQCWEAAGGPSLVLLALWNTIQAVLKDNSKTLLEKSALIDTDFMTAIELIGILISKSLVLRDMFVQEHGFEVISMFLQTINESLKSLSRFHVDQCLHLVRSLGSDAAAGNALAGALTGLLMDVALWSNLSTVDRIYLFNCICDLGPSVGKELYSSLGISRVLCLIRKSIISGSLKNSSPSELEDARQAADRMMELVVRAGQELIKQSKGFSKMRSRARSSTQDAVSLDVTIAKMASTLLQSVYDIRSQELTEVLLEKIFSFTSGGPEDLSRSLYNSRFYDIISVHLLTASEKWRPVVGTYVMGLFIWGINTVDMALSSDIYFILKRLHRKKQREKELYYDDVTIHEGLVDDGNWITKPQAVCYKALEGRANVLNRIWILSGLVSVLFRDNLVNHGAGKKRAPSVEYRNIDRACNYIADNLIHGTYQCWSVLPWFPPLFLVADASLRRILARALTISLSRESELASICLIPDGFYANYLLEIIVSVWLQAYQELEAFPREHSVFIMKLATSARTSPGGLIDAVDAHDLKIKQALEAFLDVDVLIAILARVICYQTVHFGTQGKHGLIRAVAGIEALVGENNGKEELLCHLMVKLLILIQKNECGYNRCVSILLKRSFEAIERNKLCNVVYLPHFCRTISFSSPAAAVEARPLRAHQTSLLLLCLEASKRLRADLEGIVLGAQSPESRAMFFMTRILIGSLYGASSDLSSWILKEIEAIVVFSIDFWGLFDVGMYRLFILGILSELRAIILNNGIAKEVRIGCEVLVCSISRLFFAMQTADTGAYSQLSSVVRIFSDTGRCGTAEVLFAALASKFPNEGVTDPTGIQSDRDIFVSYFATAMDYSEPPFFDVTGKSIPAAEWSEELMQMTVYPNIFESALETEQSNEAKFTDRWIELRRRFISQRQQDEHESVRRIESSFSGTRLRTETFWNDLSSKLERDCFGIRENQIWSIGDGFEGPIPGRRRTILSPYCHDELDDDASTELSATLTSTSPNAVTVQAQHPPQDTDMGANTDEDADEEIMRHLLHQAVSALQPERSEALSDANVLNSNIPDQKLPNRDWNIIEVDDADEEGGEFSESISDIASEVTEITGAMSPSSVSESKTSDNFIPPETSRHSGDLNESQGIISSESPKLKGVPIVMVTPAGSIKGMLSFTHAEIRFDTTAKLLQEHEEHGLILSELRDIKHRQWAVSSIHGIYLRNYRLRPSAVEILFNRGKYRSLFADFGFGPANFEARNKFVEAILQIAPRHAMKQWPGTSFSQLISGHEVTQEWCNGRVSNFDYLMYVNTIAGRSFNDLCQYPVMPWVIAQYIEDSIDLKNKETYRDLTKPMGAINPERLEIILERYRTLCDTDQSIPPFMYGSHYSTMAGVVMHYLIRLQPFTSLHKHLQGGRYDTYDRMFSSIPATFEQNCTRTSEVKELTPEWFSLPDFLRNVNNLNIVGRRGNAPEETLNNGDVELPKWAASPEDFIRINRAALESDYVSANLNHWIDLIFGYKQRGQAAIEANNLFYYLTYHGAVDFDKLDAATLEAVNAQITHFGQCPSQIFDRPHPERRLRIRVIPRPFWKCFDSDVGTSQTLSYGFVTAYGRDEMLVQSGRLNAVRSVVPAQKSNKCSVVADIRLYGNTVLCVRADGGVFVFSHEVSSEAKDSLRWAYGASGAVDSKDSVSSEIDEGIYVPSKSADVQFQTPLATSKIRNSTPPSGKTSAPSFQSDASSTGALSKPIIRVYCDPLLNDMSPWYSGEKNLSNRYIPMMCNRAGAIMNVNSLPCSHFVHTADNIVLSAGRSDGLVYINRLDHDSGVPVEQAYFNAHLSTVTCMASDHWALETQVITIASCDSSGVLLLWTIKRTLSSHHGKRYLISRRPHRVFRGLASPSASCDVSLVLGIAILASCNVISIFSIDLDSKLLDINVSNSIHSSMGDSQSSDVIISCNLRRIAMSDSGTIIAYIEKFASGQSAEGSYDAITHIVAAYSIAGRVTSLVELPCAVTFISCPNRGEITTCGLADGTLLFMRSSNLEIVYNARPSETCGFCTVLHQSEPGIPPSVSVVPFSSSDLEALDSNGSRRTGGRESPEASPEDKAILCVRVGPRLDRPAVVVASDASGLVYMIPLPDYVKWDRDHKMTLDVGEIVTKPVTSIINTWKSAQDLTLDAGASIVNGAAAIGDLFSKVSTYF